MIKAYAHKAINKCGWDIVLYDRRSKRCYTLEIKCHENQKDFQTKASTFIGFEHEDEEVFRALADALQQMKLIPHSAVDAELKATKFHLEDMRTLVLKDKK